MERALYDQIGQSYSATTQTDPRLAELIWQALGNAETQIPRCQGRDQALARMRIGLLANAKVAVSSLVEASDRGIAHVHSAADEVVPPERLVVAEVHHGPITHLLGYATEPEALAALRAVAHQIPAPNSNPRPEAHTARSGSR